MPNLVMDFLHGAENFGEGAVQSVINPAAKFANEVASLAPALVGNDQEVSNLTRPGGGLGHQGGILGGAETQPGAVFLGSNAKQNIGKVVGTGAQIASNIAAPELTKGSKALDFLGNVAKAAPVGAVGTAGAEIANGQPLNPGQIAEGAAATGIIGAGIPLIKAANAVPKNEVGAVGKNILNDEDAQNLAKLDNEKAIQKQLNDSVGPIVAKDVAPSIAATNDPNVVHNIVNNDVAKKITPASLSPTDVGNSPALPQPLPPQTSVSDVNTSQQVNGAGEQQVNDFLNSPTGSVAGPSAVSELGARAGMQDILQSGGTTDEALNHYFTTMPESSRVQAQKALDEVINSKGFDKSQVNAKLNPQFNNIEFPEATEGDRTTAINSAKLANNSVVRVGRPAIQAMQQLDEHDLALVRELKGNDPQDIVSQAHNPEQFSQVVQYLKDYNDYTQAAGAKLGQDLPYRQNYGLRTPYEAPEEVGSVEPNARLPESPSYTKGRVYTTHQEALENGEVPKYGSALEDLQSDINSRAHDQAQLALVNNLEKAYPGKVKIINQDDIPYGYRQLAIPGGDKIFMPQEIADDINKRAPAPVATGFTKGYDTINSEFKNLKLAGGGFHSINVVGSYLGQQLASGRLFTPTGIRDLSDVIKGTFSDSAYKSTMADLNSSGKLLDADAAGLVHDMGGVQADVKGGPVANKIPGLKQVHESIFGRQIPLLKLKTFEQQTEGLDRNNPDDLKQMTSIAKEINQNYGGLNREIQGLTPQQFQKAARIFLATDYNEGQIRSVVDAFSKGGAEGKLARQVVFGKALLFAGLATVGSAAGGEFKGQNPKQVAFNILEKTINPKFQMGSFTVGLPTTQLSEVGKPLEETTANVIKGKSAVTPVENFATARLAALPSEVEQLASNKNFYGQSIHGTDYFGRPISMGETASNIAGSVSPIPVTQAIQAGEGNQNIASALTNIVGLRATQTNPVEYSPVYGQTYLQRLKATPGISPERLKADTKFVELLGAGDNGRSKVLKKAETQVAAGDSQGAQQTINNYNQKLIKALQPWAQSGGTQYLDSTMLQILQSSMIKYKTAASNERYAAKTNPTSVGVPIAALASQSK